MSVTLSGTKTVSNTVAPHLTGSTLTTLFAIAVENLTVAQFLQISDALNRVQGGTSPSKTLGQIFS